MIVNLTPHAVTVAGVTIQPDGRVPRVAEETTHVGRLVETAPEQWQMQWSADGADMPDENRPTIPVTRVMLGELAGLPDEEPGTWFVVSRMCAEAAPTRSDLLIPGKLLRDEAGRITGAESLSVFCS